MDIRFLQKQGHSIREIARLTGHSRNTVRKLLRLQRLPTAAPRARASKLDDFKAYLRERWEAHGLSAVRLHEEITARGFTGSVQIIRRFLHTLKADQKADRTLTVRYETAPGEQAQCDWAEVGRFDGPDGKSVRFYAFVMVLSYSRYLYIEFTRSMNLETLIRCHQNAFAFFGGWPRKILYDNMRQVVVGPQQINPRFLDFSRHHGFEPKRCRPYRPRTKGKVERSISYMQDNFLNGRTFDGLVDLNAQGRQWLATAANVRLHGTTQARPCDRLLEETLMRAEDLSPYQLARSTSRTVGAEALVRYQKCDYSVPARWVGARVSVDAGDSSLLIRAGDLVIAEHPLATAPGSRVEAPAHVRERWERSLAAPVAPPPKGCHVRFEESVQTRPLSHYMEVCG
jgi:transposase